ncbi:MAG: hypothetical protein IJ497_00565, partial [Clostridia bacterium]|nr:hypothetical protein [Clostridia bacterium]
FSGFCSDFPQKQHIRHSSVLTAGKFSGIIYKVDLSRLTTISFFRRNPPPSFTRMIRRLRKLHVIPAMPSDFRQRYFHGISDEPRAASVFALPFIFHRHFRTLSRSKALKLSIHP